MITTTTTATETAETAHTAAVFTETCKKDGLPIYDCPHAYCEECGSTADVCGNCLRCAKCRCGCTGDKR